MKTIFVVDDSDTNLALAEEALEDKYRVITMSSAAKMFELLKKLEPDLILLDIEMPGMDGFEALQRLKSNHAYSDIPVIFLTGRNDDASEVRGFEIGVVDFITKPFSAPVLRNRINIRLGINEIIYSRTEQLEKLRNGFISVMAEMIEKRDEMLNGHTDRITKYIEVLVSAMKERNVYAEELSKWNIDIIVSSAQLHDVGKITISSEILNKNGKLTGDEYENVKTHAKEGKRIIERMAVRTGEEEFLQHAKLFACYHHEHWDGTGYPLGLKKTEIPLHGRIMAIIDVYDALISKRPYRDAYTQEDTVSIIMSESSKHFDPEITDVFYEVKDQYEMIAAYC